MSADKSPASKGPVFTSGKQVADYFMLNTKNLRAEKSCRYWMTKSLQDLEAWQRKDFRQEEENATLIKVAQNIERTLESLPKPNPASTKERCNTPIRLFELSKT